MTLRIKRTWYYKSFDGTAFQHFGIQYKKGWFWRYLLRNAWRSNSNTSLDKIEFCTIEDAEKFIHENLATPEAVDDYIRSVREEHARRVEQKRIKDKATSDAKREFRAEQKRKKREDKIKYITI